MTLLQSITNGLDIALASDHIACIADLRWKDKGKKEET